MLLGGPGHGGTLSVALDGAMVEARKQGLVLI